MPVRDGYKTIDLIMQELGYTEYKVRDAIKALNIEPTTFNADRRIKFYSAEDVARIKQWLESN
jgi:hypothetical protein